VARLSPQVHLHATYGDPFWRRVEAPHKVDGDNLLSSICVFGLDRKFDSVFESNVEGRTPIYSLPLVSINFGDSNVARMLIERGAAVSAAVWGPVAPLGEASEAGHKVLAQLLVDMGADVSAAGRSEWTPLHYALQMEHRRLVRLLVERGPTCVRPTVVGARRCISRQGRDRRSWGERYHPPLALAILCRRDGSSPRRTTGAGRRLPAGRYSHLVR